MNWERVQIHHGACGNLSVLQQNHKSFFVQYEKRNVGRKLSRVFICQSLERDWQSYSQNGETLAKYLRYVCTVYKIF